MSVRRILHLVGSSTSPFYVELSELYARGCIEALKGDRRYAFVIAHVSPDGAWRFPASLQASSMAQAPTMSLAQAIAFIGQQAIDVALPQMFCLPGMTHYRALLEAMYLPYLGNRPFVMALAADKSKAKAVVAAAGVRVPACELLHAGMTPTRSVPAVVKPNDADNSDGVTLVKSASDYPAALASAFAHADSVLVEDYIALGREVRCGVIERGGELVCLPIEEYRVDEAQRPIRSKAHKLAQNPHGGLSLTSKTAQESWIVAADDPIVASVHDAARRSFSALGCRQYGLFDFRIDPQGQPWFLEAGLYCSYAPHSVLVTMADAAGIGLSRFFSESIEATLRASPSHLSAHGRIAQRQHPASSDLKL